MRRNCVRAIQQTKMNAIVEMPEREILAAGSLQILTALSTDEIAARKVELEQQLKLIQSLKSLRATGRMSIRITHNRLLKGSEYDLALEDGDSLVIPAKNNVVNVMGSVMSRSSFVYSEKLEYKDYIAMAGGYSPYANKDNTYVLKIDGTAMKLARGFLEWDNADSRWSMTAFGKDIRDIEPGDTIVVPEKLEHIAWLRETKDLTQILYQIAVAAGVIIQIF